MKFSISPDPVPVGHAGIDARLKLGPRIHPSAYVVPTATVIGDVTLMEGSSVWYGAVLRGYSPTLQGVRVERQSNQRRFTEAHRILRSD
jgi:carbonic anhydrase/acetyltransferase-like protein (isoleucine patch superfamily)